MVNTLVYWSGKPIGMRRKLTQALQAQLSLLVVALTLLLAMAGVRAHSAMLDRSMLAPGRQQDLSGPGAVGPQKLLAAATRPAGDSHPFARVVLRGDYRTDFGLPAMYPYSRLIRRVATRYGLPSDLVAGVVQIESQFNPRCVSPVGAEGLMQLMPQTAELLAHKLGWHHLDLFDPGENVVLGTCFLKSLLVQFGDLRTALSYYNAGQWGIVSRGVYRNRRYISAVLTYYHRFGVEHQAMLTLRPALSGLQIRPLLAAQ